MYDICVYEEHGTIVRIATTPLCTNYGLGTKALGGVCTQQRAPPIHTATFLRFSVSCYLVGSYSYSHVHEPLVPTLARYHVPTPRNIVLTMRV